MRSLLIMLLMWPLLLCAQASKPIRIAGIYPGHTVGHYNCTCGLEAACITEAAVMRARREGLDVTFTHINMDWDILKTVRAVNRVVKERFDVAVGTLVSADAMIAAEVFEKAQVPFVVPTPTHPKVTAGRKFVTRIPFNDFRQAALLARLSVTDLKSKKIVVVRNASLPYSDFLGKEFVRNVKALDPSVTVTELPIFDGFSNYADLVERLLAQNPDLVFAPLLQPQLSSLYVNLANRNSTLTLLTSDTIEKTPKFLELLVPFSENISFIYPKHWNEKLEGPEAARYLELHSKHCGQYPPSMTTVAAYDAIELVLRALKADPSLRGAQLVKAMRQDSYEGMTGRLHYGPDGDPIKPIELFKLRGKRAFYWKRYE
jgi:branched-chain amino acid transport system substrate-binding protein